MRPIVTLLVVTAASLSDALEQHPTCGILTPAEVRDRDSFCIHLVHDATHLGELRLINSTTHNTVATRLPLTIAPGESGWWAVRDSVSWKRTGHSNKTELFAPYSFAAIYRAACVGECNGGMLRYYEVVLTFVLRGVPQQSDDVEAEYILAVTVNYPGALPGVRAESDFLDCALAGTATLQDENRAPTGSSSARRAVRPADNQPASWCWTNAEYLEVLAALGQSSGTSGTDQSIDLHNERTACEQMADAKAVNTVHIRYFLMQQQTERELLDGAERCLCAGSSEGDAEANYQQTLELLLRPFRMATRLHIHTAFVAKSVCSNNAEIDRKRAMDGTDEDVLQLPSYAEGYFNLKRSPEEWMQEWLARHHQSTSLQELHRGDEEGWDDWVHLLSPYSHAPNASIGGHRVWSRPSVQSVAAHPHPDGRATLDMSCECAWARRVHVTCMGIQKHSSPCSRRGRGGARGTTLHRWIRSFCQISLTPSRTFVHYPSCTTNHGTPWRAGTCGTSPLIFCRRGLASALDRQRRGASCSTRGELGSMN